MVRPFDCALHNRHAIRNARTHLDTTSPKTEAQEGHCSQARPNMRHNLSTLCLLQHTYRHTCNMCTKCHRRIMTRYSLP